LVWRKIERELLETEADLLAIFDCCYAGALARPLTRSPSRKIFSFVASTEADQTAIGPGADSFTSALIHSLHKLVGRSDGFSVMELLSEIQEAPYFKDTGQSPREGWRGDPPGDQRLKVRALPHAQNPEPAAEVIADSGTIDDVQYLLRLDFAFTEPLDQNHVSDFVSDLAHMIKISQSPVKHVAWGFLARRTKRLHLRRFRETAWNIVRQRRLSSMSHLGLPGHSTSTDDFFHPGGSSSCGDDAITAVADSPPALRTPSRKNSQSVHINRATDDKLNISFSFGQENDNSASTPFVFSFGETKQWSALISTALLAFAAGVFFMKGKAIVHQGRGG
jgi:hypothetical protein